MGLWLVGDQHFGVRNNSKSWLGIIESSHKDFIIPTIKKHAKEGDVILLSGDIFDNRSSIGIHSMHVAIECIEMMAKICPVHIIVGNHDLFKKNDTEITSVSCLKWIPNVTIYKEPTSVEIGNSKVAFMPWRPTTKIEGETLQALQENFNCDYAIMHGTFAEMFYNNYTKVESKHGSDTGVTKGYKRVFNGHIHWNQELGNINNLGTPYSLTRHDVGNKKGIYYFDTETETETFYENTVAPQFVSIEFYESDMNKEYLLEFAKKTKGNIVDLYIEEKLFKSKKFSKLIDKLSVNMHDLFLFPIETKLTDEEIDDEAKGITDIQTLINTALSNKFKEKELPKVQKIVFDLTKEI